MSARFARWTRPLRAARCSTVALLGLSLAACAAPGPSRPAAAPASSPVQSARDRDAAPDGAAEPVPAAAVDRFGRALAAMRGGDWVGAELELDRLVSEYPAYPGPYVNLAIVYAQDGRKEQARGMLERALGIDAGHAAANNQLGILLRDEGRFEEAEEAYRQALATDPDYALAHYNLGVLLDLYLRRQPEALEHYERYQNLLAAPDETVARWIIDLRRRLGAGSEAAHVAREDGS